MKPDRIAAEDFVKGLLDWEAGPFKPCSVAGRVDLNSARLEKTITLSNVIFEDDLEMNSASFEGGLRFENCVFQGSVDLKSAKIGGELKITGCTFEEGQRAYKRVVQMDALNLRGDLSISRLSGCRGLSMSQSDIRGSVIFHAMSMKDVALPSALGLWTNNAISMTNATVGGDLSFGIAPREFSAKDNFESLETHQDDRIKVAGHVVLNGTTVNGTIDLTNLLITDRDQLKRIEEARASENRDEPESSKSSPIDNSHPLTDTTHILPGLQCVKVTCAYFFISDSFVGGNCDLIGLEVSNVLRLNHGSTRKEWNKNLANVGGNFDLSGAKVGGQIDVEGVMIAGALRMTGGEHGSFLVSSDLKNQCVIGSVNLVDVAFASYVRVSGCQVGMADNQLRSSSSNSEKAFLGFQATACSFGNGLMFWTPRRNEGYAFRYTAWTDACQRTEIGAKLILENCKVDGDLDLTRVRVEPRRLSEYNNPTEERKVHGGIVLDSTTVTGHLRFRSPESAATGSGEDQPHRDCSSDWLLNAAQIKDNSEGDREGASKFVSDADVRARARFLHMRRATVEGDIDLSGLTINADQTEAEQLSSRAGHINAERLTVGGELSTFAVWSSTKEGCNSQRSASLIVPGALRLDDANLAELTLSRSSFPIGDAEEKIPPAKSAGVVLEEACVGTLTVPRDSACSDCSNGFPYPVSLTGMEVKHWDFDVGNKKGHRFEKKLAQSHLDFLSNDENLNRNLYRDVFGQLKNNGHDKAAEIVYAGEHDRAYENKLALFFGARFWNFLINYAYKKLLTYGVNPSPLGWGLLGLFILSFALVGSDRRNFELSSPARLLLSQDALSEEVDFAAGLGFDATDPDTLRPSPSEWSLGVGFWMTVRAHVPLVGLSAYSDIEPSTDAPVFFRFQEFFVDPPECQAADVEPLECEVTPEGLPFTPEDWFSLMSIINWVLLPIWLAFVLKRVFRSDL